jgi:hypothetical protein
LLAFDGEKAVGWCQLTPRDDLGWLNRKAAFERVDALPVWSISCFFVPRSYPRQGVMPALIAAALKAAKRAHVQALEAYPVDTARSASTSNVFTGTASAFKRLGFKTVARREPTRPVMRHDLKGIHADVRVRQSGATRLSVTCGSPRPAAGGRGGPVKNQPPRSRRPAEAR